VIHGHEFILVIDGFLIKVYNDDGKN